MPEPSGTLGSSPPLCAFMAGAECCEWPRAAGYGAVELVGRLTPDEASGQGSGSGQASGSGSGLGSG